jgi:hypothetical protein
MNTTLYDIIGRLISEQGTSILDDSKKVNAYLSDMAAKEPKPQRMAFVKCLMYGFHTELQKTNTADDRQRCKNRLAQKLFDDEGLDATLAKDTLDLLEAVLFGTVTKEPQVEPAPIPESDIPVEPAGGGSPSIPPLITVANAQIQNPPVEKHNVGGVISNVVLTLLVLIAIAIFIWVFTLVF